MDEMLKKIKEHEAYVSKVDFTGSLAFISVLLHLKRSVKYNRLDNRMQN